MLGFSFSAYVVTRLCKTKHYPLECVDSAPILDGVIIIFFTSHHFIDFPLAMYMLCTPIVGSECSSERVR